MKLLGSKNTNDLFKYVLLIVTMVNILVLSHMLTLQGAGYFGMALAFGWILIAFSSSWLSGLVARYVKGRSMRKQYRNISRFVKGAMFGSLAIGLLLSLAALFGCMFWSEFLFKESRLALCIAFVSPIILLHVFIAVLLGYYQGTGMIFPAKICSLVRSVSVFALSITGMKLCLSYGEKVAALLRFESIAYVYAAVGIFSGIIVGDLICIITIFVLYLPLRHEFKRLQQSDVTKTTESVFHSARTVWFSGFFAGLRMLFLTAAPVVNLVLFLRLTSADSAVAEGSMLFGFILPAAISLLLVLLLFTVSAFSGIPKLIRLGDSQQVRTRFLGALYNCLLYTLPISLMIAVLAGNFAGLLFGETTEENTAWLLYAGLLVFAMHLLVIFVRYLAFFGDQVLILIGAFIGFAAQTVLMVVLMPAIMPQGHVIILGVLAGCIISALVTGFFLSRRIRFPSGFLKKLAMNASLAAAGALISLLIHQLLGNTMPVAAQIAICMIPGFILYLGALVILQIYSQDEVEWIPGGKILLILLQLTGRG